MFFCLFFAKKHQTWRHVVTGIKTHEELSTDAVVLVACPLQLSALNSTSTTTTTTFCFGLTALIFWIFSSSGQVPLRSSEEKHYWNAVARFFL